MQGVRHPVPAPRLYTHNGLLLFSYTDKETAQRAFYEVDFVTFKIVDKKVSMKRTAIQEQVIFPLRAYDYVTSVAGKKDGRTVFARQIHHPLGQGTGGGDARERRWQTPDLHRGK